MPALPLPFVSPRLADAPAVRSVVGAALQSDLAFANMYLLRHKYNTEIALEDGFLFRHFNGHSRLQGYAFPRGTGDIAEALRRIEQDAHSRSRAFRFCLLPEQERQVLEQLYPERFVFHADPGDADYVYERSVLANLPGARFHRKRNHVARFMRECPTWNLQALSPDNAADALAVADAWLADAQVVSLSPALLHEREAIAHALEAMAELQLLGAVLYVEEQPVAMCIASMISPAVADVHYEKCIPSFRSAYPLINRGFASMLSCRFINREEDLNFPGLRQAKRSYFPFLILSKYSAVPC